MIDPIPYFPLTMTRDHLRDLPWFAAPEGYTIRTFRSGDEILWARIETLAGEFASEHEALRRFDQFFGSDIQRLSEGCFFPESERGEPIGTAATWPGRLEGELRGQVS
jgi:hypothetical protein